MRQASLALVKGCRDEQRDGDQMGDCSTKQEKNDKICLQFQDERCPTHKHRSRLHSDKAAHHPRFVHLDNKFKFR